MNMWICSHKKQKTVFTLIHPDVRFMLSNFPQFILHLSFFPILPCPVLNLFFHLFIYLISHSPVCICGICMRRIICISHWAKWKSGLAFCGWWLFVPGLFFLWFPVFVVWPTCLLSHSVCFTRFCLLLCLCSCLHEACLLSALQVRWFSYIERCTELRFAISLMFSFSCACGLLYRPQSRKHISRGNTETYCCSTESHLRNNKSCSKMHSK